MSAARDAVVWSLPGQAEFAAVVGRALGHEVRIATDIPECEVVHIVGVYDCPAFMTTLDCTRPAKRRVYHWMGPDATNRFWSDCLPAGVHLCPGEGVRDVLRTRGIDAGVLPLPTPVQAKVTPLPDSGVIAAYGGIDPLRYGVSMTKALRECLPGVEFIGYMKGEFTSEQMSDVIARTRVYLRLRAIADGALSSREFLAAGRRVVSTDDLPFATRVRRDDLPGVLAAVRAALAEPEPDLEAAAYWAPRNTDARFAEEIGRIR